MALLESGPALWQQENVDAPPSTKLRSGKAAAGSENSMATPYMAKQTGKQPSQTARKALSNISNINHLHKQPLQPSKAQQPLATNIKSQVTISNDAVDAEAAPTLDTKMDALAAQLALSDGIERLAGRGWDEQHAEVQHTAMRDAAARANAMAALANSAAALSLAETPALVGAGGIWCTLAKLHPCCPQALEPEACPPSPPATAPFTGRHYVPSPCILAHT